jgi:transcriptional regulator with XRE-family HTH domain
MTARLIDLDAVLARHRLTRRDLREVLGVSEQAVNAWVTGRNRISPEMAIQAERLLKIARYELRPDLWPPPVPMPPPPPWPGAKVKPKAAPPAPPAAPAKSARAVPTARVPGRSRPTRSPKGAGRTQEKETALHARRFAR